MIYMTTDEWHEISKLIEENDFYKLAEEIASRTYDLDISKQELDRAIKDYAIKDAKQTAFQGKTLKGYNTLSITKQNE